jgi:hypothetical protein
MKTGTTKIKRKSQPRPHVLSVRVCEITMRQIKILQEEDHFFELSQADIIERAVSKMFLESSENLISSYRSNPSKPSNP